MSLLRKLSDAWYAEKDRVAEERDGLEGEIKYLRQQCARLLAACKALVEPPLASGFFDDSMNWTCGYCNAYADDHVSIEHRHDCEIQLGRALIAEISSLGDE